LLACQSVGPFLAMTRGVDAVAYDVKQFPRVYVLRAHAVASGR
jgi:hypothetical protein